MPRSLLSQTQLPRSGGRTSSADTASAARPPTSTEAIGGANDRRAGRASRRPLDDAAGARPWACRDAGRCGAPARRRIAGSEQGALRSRLRTADRSHRRQCRRRRAFSRCKCEGEGEAVPMALVLRAAIPTRCEPRLRGIGWRGGRTSCHHRLAASRGVTLRSRTTACDAEQPTLALSQRTCGHDELRVDRAAARRRFAAAHLAGHQVLEHDASR